MDIQELIGFSTMIDRVIAGMPMPQKIVASLAFLGLSSFLYLGTVSSFIFNYIIIPGIEKRAGKKLQYDPLYNFIVFSKWMTPQAEVSLYIVRRYFALLFKGESGLPEKRNRFALKKIGFTIGMATRFEILMSFLWLLSVLVIVICGVTVIIINGRYRFFP